LYRDLSVTSDIPLLGTTPLPHREMVYGIPVVVGAKKGFPNFNLFAMQTATTVSRNLWYHRLSTTSFETNQNYNMGISNVFGVEAWNSYNTNFTRPYSIFCNASVGMGLTNESAIANGRVLGPSALTPFVSFYSNQITISSNFWTRSGISAFPGARG